MSNSESEGGMNMDMSFVEWLANGERGVSSNTIATHLSGKNCLGVYQTGSPPFDARDFMRCQKLLDAVPSFKARLGEMRTVSFEWEIIVRRWDDIEIQLALDVENNCESFVGASSLIRSLLEMARERMIAFLEGLDDHERAEHKSRKGGENEC